MLCSNALLPITEHENITKHLPVGSPSPIWAFDRLTPYPQEDQVSLHFYSGIQSKTTTIGQDYAFPGCLAHNCHLYIHSEIHFSAAASLSVVGEPRNSF